MLIAKIGILIMSLTVTLAQQIGYIDIAVVIFNTAPAGIIEDSTILSRGYINDTTITGGDVTQLIAQRGIWTWYISVLDNGGIPVNLDATQKVIPRLLVLNVGTNSSTIAANTELFATRIATGYYTTYGYNITVVYPDYHLGTYQPYQAACESTKQCVVMATLLATQSLYSCTATGTPPVLPSDCVAANRIAGQRRYDYTYCSLQPGNYLLYDWIQYVSRLNAKTMAIVSSASNAIAITPTAVAQGISVGVTTIYQQGWSTSPTQDSLIAMATAIVAANPDVVNLICSGAEAEICYTFFTTFNTLNWTPQAIIVADGAMSVLASPDYPLAMYAFGVVPWDRSVSGQDYITTTTPGDYEQWPTVNGTYTPEVYSRQLDRLFPDMPDLYLPIPAIVTEGFLMMQKAIERSGTLEPTADQIRTAINSLYQPSLLGIMQVDTNGQIVQTPRLLYQTYGSSNVKFVNQVSQLDLVYPMPTWAQRNDGINFTLNQYTILIAVGTCLLGVLTSLFITEQAINSHVHEESLYITGMWLLGASTTATFGEWSSIIVTMTSLSPSNLSNQYNSLSYDPGAFFGVLALPLFLNLGAYCIMLSGISVTKSTFRPRLRDYDTSVGSDRTAKSGNSWTQDIKELTENTQVSKIWIAVAGLIFEGGIIGTHFITWQGINISADKSVKNINIICGAIFSYILATLSLWLYFHIRRTRWRITFPLLMLGATIFFNLLALSGTVLSRNTVIPADGVTSQTIIITAVVVVGISSFILFSFNISSMKLSRDTLDRFLAAEQQKTRRLQKEIRDLTTDKFRLTTNFNILRIARPIGLSNHPLLGAYFDASRLHELEVKSQKGNDLIPDHHDSILLNKPNDSEINITLEHILGNPVTLEIFKDEALESKDFENITFIIDVQNYNQHKDSTIREKISEYIFMTYLSAESPRTINISDTLSTQMISKLKDKKVSSDNLFNEAYNEIINLVRRNNFSRFINKPQYHLCKRIIMETSRR